MTDPEAVAAWIAAGAKLLKPKPDPDAARASATAVTEVVGGTTAVIEAARVTEAAAVTATGVTEGAAVTATAVAEGAAVTATSATRTDPKRRQFIVGTAIGACPKP